MTGGADLSQQPLRRPREARPLFCPQSGTSTRRSSAAFRAVWRRRRRSGGGAVRFQYGEVPWRFEFNVRIPAGAARPGNGGPATWGGDRGQRRQRNAHTLCLPRCGQAWLVAGACPRAGHGSRWGTENPAPTDSEPLPVGGRHAHAGASHSSHRTPPHAASGLAQACLFGWPQHPHIRLEAVKSMYMTAVPRRFCKFHGTLCGYRRSIICSS